MSDALHDDRRCAPRQFVQGGIPLGALADPGAHLDELVILERPIELVDDAVREPGIAQQNQGMQRMREAAKVFLLLFGNCHGRHYRGLDHRHAQTNQE